MLMRRITRYIILEMLKVFLTTLLVMTSIMLLIGLAQRALREGMGPIPVLRLIPFVLPDALRFAIPGTLLFATCSLYGRPNLLAMLRLKQFLLYMVKFN